MDNGLQFHPSKWKTLSFGFHDLNFTLGDQFLPSIEQTDDLGIIVSNNLSWNKHIDSVGCENALLVACEEDSPTVQKWRTT